MHRLGRHEWLQFLESSRVISHLLLTGPKHFDHLGTLPSWVSEHGCIFPNLRALTLHRRIAYANFTEKKMSNWLALLAPSITSIDVFDWDVPDAALLWMSTLNPPPTITAAWFVIRVFHPTYTGAALGSLVRLKLEGLVQYADWKALSEGCLRLEKLDLEVRGRKGILGPSEESESVTFRSMDALVFRLSTRRYHGHAYIKMILIRTNFPNLRCLELWDHGITIIALNDISIKFNRETTLETLTIHHAPAGPSLQDTIGEWRWPKPPQTLIVRNRHGGRDFLFMNDMDWEELAATRPGHLKCVVIEQEPPDFCHHGTSCTVKALLSLAKHQGWSLESLTMSITDEFEIDDLHLLDNRLTELRSLTFQHVQVAEALVDALARLLAVLCPKLTVFRVECLQLRASSGSSYRCIPGSILEEAYWKHQAPQSEPAASSSDVWS